MELSSAMVSLFQRIKIRCYKYVVPTELIHVVGLLITDFIPSYQTGVTLKEP